MNYEYLSGNYVDNDETEEYELSHYGTPRHSGRYPWGSGKDPYQHNSEFYKEVRRLRKEKISDEDIAKSFGFVDEKTGKVNMSEFRNQISISRAQLWTYNAQRAGELHDHGYSNVEIGKIMGCNESMVRNYLKPELQERNRVINDTAEMLKAEVAEKGYIDVGTGTELYLGTSGVSQDKLTKALATLKGEGYEVYGDIKQPYITDKGRNITLRVLCPPGTTKGEVYRNRDKIQAVTSVIDPNSVEGYQKTQFPKSINSKRIFVRYADDPNESGASKDGVIEIRPGVEDISLGKDHYSQVRIAVDGTHYMKGMAIYSDDIPEGYDIIYNSNKTSDRSFDDVFKPLKIDKATGEVDKVLPFGSTIKRNGQRLYKDPNGDFIDFDGDRASLSLINKVNEEGDWNSWGKTVSSQFLSKQDIPLIKRQLGLSYDERVSEFEKISSYTNPTVKKKLLLDFAEDCDAAAVHLKATGFPGQRSQVILPLNAIKETEVYATNFNNGDKVALIRYPHAGLFEIPILTVNNNNPTGKKIFGQMEDAIGINVKTAEQLSGADFDGDTVTVIPLSDTVKIKNRKPLEGLATFDPKKEYPGYEGMVVLSKSNKQSEMGKISNLITDMTLKGAPIDEIERAVRHSMVVIDAEKHKLDYKKSFSDNRIQELKEKWQKSDMGSGAGTLISRSKSEARIPEQKQWFAKESTESSPTGINPLTGEKITVPSNRMYNKVKRKLDKTSMEETVTYTPTLAEEKTTKMAITNDAFTLSSGTEKEAVYATYANNLKQLANKARKLYLETGDIKKNPEAAKKYSVEVNKLKADLEISLRNSPRERQAQIIANALYSAKVSSNPDIKDDKSLDKKIRARCLEEARGSIGAKKKRIDITPDQWEAIQEGAIGSTDLKKILDNTDMALVRKYATPRGDNSEISASKQARIKSYISNGKTASEIADAIGVSVSTVLKYAKE